MTPIPIWVLVWAAGLIVMLLVGVAGSLMFPYNGAVIVRDDEGEDITTPLQWALARRKLRDAVACTVLLFAYVPVMPLMLLDGTFKVLRWLGERGDKVMWWLDDCSLIRWYALKMEGIFERLQAWIVR